MNRKSLRIVIILATVSLTGIFAIQIYWVKRAFNLEESQFNQKVHVAMTNVAKEILTINKEGSQLSEPVKQIGSNYFIASINDTLHPYLLQSLLLHEFARRKIDIDFEYVIYDCFTDSIVYSNYISMNKEETEQTTGLQGMEWKRDGHYFGVYFPGKQSYLVNQMAIWIFSSSILLLVAIYFGYTTYVILRQKKLSEIRRDFISNLTHEFKTPISTISLSTDVLLNEETQKDPQRIRHYAEIIKQENNRLKIQVDKVLQLSALDIKNIALNREIHHVHECIQEACKGFGLILQDKNGKLSTDLSAERDACFIDTLHFTNIVYNLIDNAIKYSDENPEVHIKTYNDKEHIYIEVKDKGIGIDKKQQKLIFDKFYRVPTGNVHDVKGFGLGLNYVRTVMEMQEGSIQLKSTVGKGSTFTLILKTTQ